jgi:peptidylprolyl isomerase
MTITALILPLLAQASAAQAAGRVAPDPLSPAQIVAAAPAGEWRGIAAENLLVMDLAPDARGRARRVTIQLMPPPFSQGWVANIRLLARARWWDGTSVNRVQDNYVAQWGDATENKALPAGLNKVVESEYDQPGGEPVPATGMMAGDMQMFSNEDAYASLVGFTLGFPSAQEGTKRWPVHCYGTVGVGRDLSPNTGTGAELYTVIGHAPRHLDRNIAVVGRVVEGIEHLSSLPRGTEALGFYKTAEERTLIRSIRLGSDLPEGERPRFEYLSTEGASFAAYADARANRRDAFFIRPAGGADICNVPVPVRRVR